MPPPRHHDAQSNRFLLLAVFVFGAMLLYLTTHRPPQNSSSSSSSSSLRDATKQKVPPLRSNQQQQQIALSNEPLSVGTGKVIQHRIVAVGDIHGDHAALTSILRKASLIDLKGQWIGGETVLVQTGDIVDRGPDTIACYRFMQTLRGQAEKSGGAVVSLLGNHEIMNALGDWRYVSAKDIKSFGGERNRREALLTGWIGQEWRANYSITARVPYLYHEFPSTSTLVEFPSTPVGISDRRFLSEPRPFRSTTTKKDNPFAYSAASFVHGGITPEYLRSLEGRDDPITTINRIGHSILESLLNAPGAPMSLPRGSTPEQREFWSERGPMWNREWALEEESEICQRVKETCERLGVRRLVMGHTPHFEGMVKRCDGMVLLVDTGISRAYGGAHSFLEISHELTPRSLLTLEDALEFDLLLESPLGSSTAEEGEEWLEREVIKAVYADDDRKEEELVRFERIVRVSP